MVGRGSIGRAEVPSPEGGGGVTGIWFSFLYKHELFQIVVYHLKSIKWIANPSKKVCLFSVRYQRSQIKPVVLQYSLVYREDKFLAEFLSLVSSPWLLGVAVHLRLILWSVHILIVHWGTMGLNTRHLSSRWSSLCRCWGCTGRTITSSRWSRPILRTVRQRK